MHIHGNPMSINPVNPYAAAAEKAAAAQRAADVRKRLLKSAASAAAATPEETLMIGQWLDSRHSQVRSDAENHTAAAGRDPDFG